MGQGASALASTPTDGFLLTIAAKEGQSDIAQLFLKKNPALAFHTLKDKNTAMHYASEHGHQKILELLVQTIKQSAASNTFDPVQRILNQQNDKGQTPLMLACKQGQAHCVHFLIKHNASVWPADPIGRTCLHFAARKGSDRCVRMVIARAAQEENVGHNPALEESELARFINLPDIYGRTALHCIAWSGDVRGAQTLLSAGARLTAQAISDCYDMELPCNSGATPLHVATLKENVDMVLLILNAYVQGLESGSCVEDPRAIMDAYSVLPHAIADKHGKEDLEQLLDPSTDITAAFKSLQDQQRQAALTTSTEASTSGGSSSHPSAAFNPAKYQSATLEARRFAANRPSSSSSVLTAGERPSGDGASSLGSPTATAAATAAAGADYSSLVAAGAEQQEEVPLALLCALTQRLLHDPVVAADGFTYERDAWVGWLEQGNKTSPVTKAPLPSLEYFPNHALCLILSTWSKEVMTKPVEWLFSIPLDNGKDYGSRFVWE
eukprot:jgi/Chrzof1/9714/Cz04g13050.t1